MVAEDESACQHPRGDAGEPRDEEAAAREDERPPRREERERVGGVAARRDAAVVLQPADRREGDDRDRAGEAERSQKNRRTPRKSLVRTGTMRTSLREFGASIIRPPPTYIATWPTTGCS